MDRIFQHQTVENFTTHEASKLKSSSSALESQRNETSIATSRAKRTLARGTSTGPIRIPPKQECHASLLPGLVTPIKDQAINLFLSTHVFHESKTPRGYFEYLPPLYGKSSSTEPLSLSLDAVALAAFANTVRSLSIMKHARMKLVLALRAVNGALGSGEEATKDSTLAAIMLLSTFETITCQNQQSLTNCDTHLSAATTIIKYVFQMRESLLLRVHVCSATLA